MPKKVSFTFHYKNAGVVSVVSMDGLIAEAGTVLSLHHNHAEIPAINYSLIARISIVLKIYETVDTSIPRNLYFKENIFQGSQMKSVMVLLQLFFSDLTTELEELLCKTN